MWTYTGNTGGNSTGTVSVYINGVLTVTQQRQLNILRPTGTPSLIHVGNWFNDDVKQYNFPSGAAIGALRVHDGVLSLADITNNYAAERPNYFPSGNARTVDPDNLDPAGGQLVVLNGANFGPISRTCA